MKSTNVLLKAELDDGNFHANFLCMKVGPSYKKTTSKKKKKRKKPPVDYDSDDSDAPPRRRMKCVF